MTPGEVQRYEELHCLVAERLGRDLIGEYVVKLRKDVLRDSAPKSS
jgi:hypothetical protein